MQKSSCLRLPAEKRREIARCCDNHGERRWRLSSRAAAGAILGRTPSSAEASRRQQLANPAFTRSGECPSSTYPDLGGIGERLLSAKCKGPIGVAAADSSFDPDASSQDMTDEAGADVDPIMQEAYIAVIVAGCRLQASAEQSSQTGRREVVMKSKSLHRVWARCYCPSRPAG